MIGRLKVIGFRFNPAAQPTALSGDRVQWFRALAEMERWQEEKEQKLAELLRTSRSFSQMQLTWTTLAAQSSSPGHAAYARQKAAMYGGFTTRTQQVIRDIGYSELLALNGSIMERVQRERASESALIENLVFGSE
jgi:leucyl aminopeptidase (aminopeptidase T)